MIRLGEFKKFLQLCGYPQQGKGGGGGVGLKSVGVLAQSVTPASVTGTTSQTTVITDTIPAGTISAGSILQLTGGVTKTGTGTCALRVFVSDGTNSIQSSSGTSPAGASAVVADNIIVVTGTASQVTNTNGSIGGGASSIISGALDATKTWTVSWTLQQSVGTDTSTLYTRRIMVSNQ